MFLTNLKCFSNCQGGVLVEVGQYLSGLDTCAILRYLVLTYRSVKLPVKLRILRQYYFVLPTSSTL